MILPLRVRNPSTQFKKLLRIERRTLWNSWCVIDRSEVIQLEIAVNRCKRGAAETHRLPRVSGLLLWIICRVKRIYVLRREKNSIFPKFGNCRKAHLLHNPLHLFQNNVPPYCNALSQIPGPHEALNERA